MRATSLRLALLTSAVLWAAQSFQTSYLYADPGELFPDTPAYNEQVNAPVSQQEKSLKKPAKVSKPPREKIKPVEKPEEKPTEKPTEKPVEKPIEKPAEIERHFAIDRFQTNLFLPLLADKDQSKFDEDYAAKVTKALASPNEVRRRVSDDLKQSADGEGEGLKRYLLLHAVGLSIRGTAPLADRETKALAVLPLLTEETLAVQQAKADCLTNLIGGAAQNATDKLLEMSAESHATLARLQVMGGYPKEAAETIRKARESVVAMKEKKTEVGDLLAESQAWVDRGNQAILLWPRLQTTLKTTPNDAYSNTQIANLHLSLYGDVAAAAPFAAKSDRAELKALAAALKQAGITEPTAATSVNPKDAVKVCSALVEVAKSTPVAFDKYSIAVYAAKHLDKLRNSSEASAEDVRSAKLLFNTAIEVAQKSGIRSRYVVANDPTAPTKSDKKGDAAVAVKEADGFNSLGAIFADCPADWFVNGSIKPGNRSKLNKHFEDNVVGKTITLSAPATHMGTVVRDEMGREKYVPFYMSIPKMELRGMLVSVSIECKLPAAKAAAAGNIPIGQVTKVTGTIDSIDFYPGTSSYPGSLTIVVSPPK